MGQLFFWNRLIEKWKTVTLSEPDERLRDEFAGLARVFADLAKRGRIWRQTLEGWNVKRSESVMEWQAEARAEAEAKARSEAVLDVLQLRFGAELPDELVTHIRGTTDLTLLKRRLAAVVQARTLNKFRQTLET